MSRFLDELDLKCHPTSDKYFVLAKELRYFSDTLRDLVTIPAGFVTDLASIPLYIKWSHREGVLHDYLYRVDSIPIVTFDVANSIFLEAMNAQKKVWWIKWTMYAAVHYFGKGSYHQKPVAWTP